MSEELPELEFVEHEPTHEESSVEEVRTGASTRRWPWLVVAVVAGAVGLLVATSGDDAGTPSSTPAPTSVVDRPGGGAFDVDAGDDRFLRGTPTALLGQAVGAVVLLIGDEEWRLVDLDTGFVDTVPSSISGVGSRPIRSSAVALDGRIVVLDQRRQQVRAYDVERAVDDRTRFREVADFRVEVPDGARLAALFPATGDEFWLVTIPGSGELDDVQAQRVGRDGSALGPPFATGTFPRYGTSAGVVVDSGARIFLIDESARRDLGAGGSRAASVGFVAAVACDPDARCTERVIEVPTGRVAVERAIPFAQATEEGSSFVAVSDDGTLASISEAGRNPTLNVSRIGTSSTGLPLTEVAGSPAWLPDGRRLLVLAAGGVVQVGDIEASLAGSRIEGLRGDEAFSLVVVPV